MIKKYIKKKKPKKRKEKGSRSDHDSQRSEGKVHLADRHIHRHSPTYRREVPEDWPLPSCNTHYGAPIPRAQPIIKPLCTLKTFEF